MKNSNQEIVWLNGKLISKDHAYISPDDRGFLFADGVYEVVRWYGRYFLGMEDHLRRLKRSLSEMRIEGFSVNDFPLICKNLLEANSLQNAEAIVYIEITRGAAPRTHFFPSPKVDPTVYAFARKILPDRSLEKKGVPIIVLPDIRWMRCDIKSVSLIGNVLSYQKAKENNMFECIFQREEIITEASHSNIFFVRNGILRTHPESPLILSGITRGIVLRLAIEAGISVKEEPVRYDEIASCEEAFLTSTSVEIMPVVMIDGKCVGSGDPGKLTKSLQDTFENFLNREQ